MDCMLNKTLVGLLFPILMGVWACAAITPKTTTVLLVGEGDQDLRRGVYWYQKGCMRKAMDHFQAAHEQYSLADQPAGVARSLNSMANVHRQQGNRESALLFYDAAMAAGRRCDDQAVLAQALANKAALLIDAEDFSAAEVLLEEARLLAGERGAVFALVLNYQAVLKMKADQVRDAAALLDQADAAAMGKDPGVRATIRFSQARLRLQADDQPTAMHLFAQALALDRYAGCSRCMADDLAAMAEVHERLGEDEAAQDCLERSLKIYALLENRAKVNQQLDRLERLAVKTGGDLRLTVHFIHEWLEGKAIDAICR